MVLAMIYFNKSPRIVIHLIVKKLLILAAVSGFLLLTPGQVLAAKHGSDPTAGLDGLFQQLQSAPTYEKALGIEQLIWGLWMNNDQPLVTSRMQIGVYFMQQGRLDMAYQVFSDVVKLDPTYAEGWNKRATVAYMMGQLQPSIIDIQKTLALEPRHFGALSGLGLIHILSGQPETALKVFKKVLEIYPQNIGAQKKIIDLKKIIAKNNI